MALEQGAGPPRMAPWRAALLGLVWMGAATAGVGPLREARTQDSLDGLLARMRHAWTDEELPADALLLDLDLEPRGSVRATEAAEDAERLFDLLRHGWSGWGLFDQGGRFAAARAAVLAELATRETWQVDDLPDLFRAHLGFVRDCHTRVGGLAFGVHRDLWMDDGLELHRREGAWGFEQGGAWHELVAVDGQPPEALLRPSLTREGERVHRLAVLAVEPPAPLELETRGPQGGARRQVRLRRSTFERFAREVFREDRVGGIGVLRVRGFGDADPEALQRFVESAERYRDAPCVVVDLRGNGGGNERWASDWIERLTGRRPRSALVLSELESRTTMAGRLNAHLWWDRLAPGVEAIRRGVERYGRELARFAPGGEAPRWTGPYLPDNSTIPNDTTVIVVTNGLVASAGEGFVMRMRQAENVVVVGENTRGALTFGNVSLHQLPRSGLQVWLPINLNVFGDLAFREEVGLEPDFWVPAHDAVNRAVAALRSGTIPTVRPLGAEILERPFVREDPLHRRRRAVVGLAGLVAGALLAWGMRRRARSTLPMGLAWLLIGAAWLWLGRTRGPLLTDGGLAFCGFGLGLLAWALLVRRGTLRAPRPTDQAAP